MLPPKFCWLMGILLVVGLASAAVAQIATPTSDEATAGEEETDSNPYSELRQSTNRGTKALADRYDDITSLVEWTDKSGKHKVKARYVEHDPDMKWVKLEVVTGSGEKRVSKEVQLKLDQLNKAGQSRVRQIAALQRKLDELAQLENETATSSAEAPVAGRGERYGRGERGSSAEDEAGATTVAGDAADATQWRASYSAFRANFKLVKNENGERTLDWGELQPLKALTEAAASTTDRGERQPIESSTVDENTATLLGEVRWEAPFLKTQAPRSGDHEIRFKLPALPRPLRVRFLLDPEEQYRTWSDTPADELVRFVGKFETVSPREIFLRIRRDDPNAANAAPAPDRATDRRGAR